LRVSERKKASGKWEEARRTKKRATEGRGEQGKVEIEDYHTRKKKTHGRKSLKGTSGRRPCQRRLKKGTGPPENAWKGRKGVENRELGRKAPHSQDLKKCMKGGKPRRTSLREKKKKLPRGQMTWRLVEESGDGGHSVTWETKPHGKEVGKPSQIYRQTVDAAPSLQRGGREGVLWGGIGQGKNGDFEDVRKALKTERRSLGKRKKKKKKQ